MKVIGLEILNKDKPKLARVVIVFQDEEGRVAQWSVPFRKLRFIKLAHAVENA